MTPAIQNPFFPTHKKIAGAGHQLVCFPYAGGASLAYRTWETKLAPSIEVLAAELPGRGRRFREPPYQRLDALVPVLVDSMMKVLDGRPFSFFGHSMGGVIAFEVAHHLHRMGARLPSVLFLSARGTGERDNPIHHLSEPAFIAKLRGYSGTPEEVLANPELMELFLPTLRADFAIALASKGIATEGPLPIPIEAMGGTHDPHVPTEDLPKWAARTTGAFNSTVFPGGHFYIREAEDDVHRLIKARLSGVA
ncbi:alpha/beta fold hydrolase [Pendulispora brunnea]|uniref:Alpha/beta fold hydrolase n=1 Tax=Pendulispora brunnea TaxID=2905690 RepID=A0ABZ2KEU6_9BACT